MVDDAAESQSEELGRPPPLLVVPYRAAIAVLLCAYYFIIVCVARGFLGGIGWSFGTSFQVFLTAALMTAFVVWLAPIVEIPEIWFERRLPAQRRARGQCPSCGYVIAKDAPNPKRCPECGAIDAQLPPWQFSGKTLRRFFALAAIGYALGTASGAWWTAHDESEFRLEAAQAGRAIERHRAWPATFSMLFADDRGAIRGQGLSGESEVDPRWTPRVTQ